MDGRARPPDRLSAEEDGDPEGIHVRRAASLEVRTSPQHREQRHQRAEIAELHPRWLDHQPLPHGYERMVPADGRAKRPEILRPCAAEDGHGGRLRYRERA